MNLSTLWIPSWYPHKGQLFYGSFVYRQALATSQFCEVNVLYVVESDDSEIIMKETQINANFFQLVIYVPKNKWRIGKLMQFWKGYQVGWKRLKQLNKYPKIAHLHIAYPAGIFTLWLKWKHHIPFVISEHWSGYRKESQDYKGWFLKRLIEKSVQQSKKVITVSTQGKLAMQARGLTGDYTIIPNVVKVEKSSQRVVNNKGKCHLLHVSSLEDRHKNIIGLLKVIKKIAAIRNDFFLEIIGGNPLENRLYFEKKVSEMGLGEVVRFSGLIPNDEMGNRYAAADVFVSFSNMEGLSCAMLEALGAGLPVIATETGDVEKWVIKESGKVIKIADESALEMALLHMLDHHQTYNAEKIKKRIIDTCGYEVVGKRILEVYEEVLNAE